MKYSKEFLTNFYRELLSTRMAEEKLVEIYALLSFLVSLLSVLAISRLG
mgnify:CR=1 FL=1